MSMVLDRLRPLFSPRGIVVTGVSAHPGKFGSVAYHNLLAGGFAGEIFPINRDGATCYGHATYRSVAEVPPGRADFAFMCTPSAVNEEILRACAAIGMRAASFAWTGVV